MRMIVCLAFVLFFFIANAGSQPQKPSVVAGTASASTSMPEAGVSSAAGSPQPSQHVVIRIGELEQIQGSLRSLASSANIIQDRIDHERTLSTSTLVSIFSIILSIGAIWFSYHSLRENTRVLKWTNNYQRLVEAEKMFSRNPELLALHGITPEMLRTAGVSAEEVVYLLQSFRAGQESWEIDPKGESKLTPYRLHMLKQPRVAKVWSVLHGNLFFRTGFVLMVDEHLRKASVDVAQQQAQADGPARGETAS